MDASFIADMFGELAPIAPQILMIAAALAIPGIFFVTKKGKACAAVALVMAALSAGTVGLMMSDGMYGEYGGLFSFDAFSGLMMLLFLTVAFIAVLISPASPEVSKHQGEYYSLICAAAVGMMFVASASSLLVIFVGVEVVSILSYAMVALKKNDPRSAEAGVKYLIIGGMSSGLTLYGISMLYGLTGTVDIAGVAEAIAGQSFSLSFAVAMIAMIAGYGFKIAAVPFHMWAPDVYEGAATPISGLLATGSKKMGFVVMFKIFLVMFVIAQCGFATQEMQWVFALVAAVTMTVGNVVAISQTNIKRMLAYSSIAQAGYIMIVLAVMSQYALTGGLFHMFTHVFMKGGAFVVVAALIAAGIGENISDYRGLAKRAPVIAFAMMLFLFSLAGIPPLAGFSSKFVLFSSAIFVDGAVQTQWVWLALIAILNSAISLYYYVRVVKAMYIEKGPVEEKIKVKPSHLVAVLICVVGVVLLGVYPGPLLDLCADAAAQLFLVI